MLAKRRVLEELKKDELLAAVDRPDFWSTLGRVLPDYEERREALRRLGERLVW